MTSVLIFFHYHLVSWCKLQIHPVGGPSDFVWVRLSSKIQQSLHYTQGLLKLAHINFAILNIIAMQQLNIQLRFIKNIYFYVVKQKNRKQLYWLFFKQENCYNKITYARKSYISKSVKKIEEKFRNILAFDKESKRKLLSHSADSFIKNDI